MIDEILRYNLIIRELINATLMPLFVCMCLVITISLYETYREVGRGWSTAPGVQAACTLYWVFVAEALRASMAWSVLFLHRIREQPPGQFAIDMSKPDEFYFVSVGFMVGGIVLVIFMLRSIYIFTPDPIKHVYWLGAVGITLSFDLVTILI